MGDELSYARRLDGATQPSPIMGGVSTYTVTLQARPGRTTATAHWAEQQPALRKYREWVGMYGTGDVVIELTAEDDDGSRRVLKRWPPDADEQGGAGR